VGTRHLPGNRLSRGAVKPTRKKTISQRLTSSPIIEEDNRTGQWGVAGRDAVPTGVPTGPELPRVCAQSAGLRCAPLGVLHQRTDLLAGSLYFFHAHHRVLDHVGVAHQHGPRRPWGYTFCKAGPRIIRSLIPVHDVPVTIRDRPRRGVEPAAAARRLPRSSSAARSVEPSSPSAPNADLSVLPPRPRSLPAAQILRGNLRTERAACPLLRACPGRFGSGCLCWPRISGLLALGRRPSPQAATR